METVQGYSDCRDFSALCQKRVGLLEEYRKQADKVIEESEARNQATIEELDGLKRQRNILGPIAAGLLGIAAGIIYQQNQN